MQKSDGMKYAPAGKPAPVCKPGDFTFAAVALDHGHIYGMSQALVDAGAGLKWVYDPDPSKVGDFRKAFPSAKVAENLDQILDDPEVRLVASAAVPCDRGPLGCRVMEAGKDYFVDKTPFTSLSQLEEAQATVQRTGRRFFVYYSERLHTECGMLAGDIIAQGVIGKVVQVIGLGPHRLNAKARPTWFFEKAKYGGLLTDIGSHQAEQYLHYAGETDAEVLSARVANVANPQYPELEDFGEATLQGAGGTSNYYRVDWLTPDGLGAWGDGRTLILGTTGYIELRKYLNIAGDRTGNHLYLVTSEKEEYIDANDTVGYPFFGKLILDSLNRTDHAMTQAHIFKAAELCLRCQEVADAGNRK